MTLTARVSPGDVLRAWRLHVGLTQQQLTDALAAVDGADGKEKAEFGSKTAVANWEAGVRSPSPHTVRKIARALRLDIDEQDALVGLWRAAGSVGALPPRPYWEHNYDAEGGRPAWMWLRCDPDGQPVTASAGWGPFGDDIEVPATAAGVLAYSPASVPNPPLQVTFAEAAWADFGDGVVPSEVIERLGMLPVAGAVVFHGRFSDPPELTEPEPKRVKVDLAHMQVAASKFQVIWDRVRPHMGHMRPNVAVLPLRDARIVQTDWTDALRSNGRGELVSQLLQTPDQIKKIRRQGRKLSAEAAAQAANELKEIHTEFYVTANQIENLERSGTLPPHAQWIIARLDRAYGLDGYLGIERVVDVRVDRQGRSEIDFPAFWVGPIWLQVLAPAASSQRQPEGTLDLRWGHWRRLQQIQNGTVVTTRKAVPRDKPKLVATLPPGWRLAAGTGLPTGAVDINRDWYPASFAAAAQLVLEGFAMLRKKGHV